MPGYNHSASCTCGWCYKTSGRSDRGVVYASIPIGRAFERLESYTVPNALCPVCGETVFFYQSLAGGRVFFDELGPPWPKHPCTDNRMAVRPFVSSRATSSQGKPNWDSEGWMPVSIKSSSMVGTWHFVMIEILERRHHLVILSAEPVRAPKQYCAAFDGFDRVGHARLSIVDLDRMGSERMIEVYEADRFAGTSAFDVKKARQRGGLQ